jgi:hypothetical protein
MSRIPFVERSPLHAQKQFHIAERVQIFNALPLKIAPEHFGVGRVPPSLAIDRVGAEFTAELGEAGATPIIHGAVRLEAVHNRLALETHECVEKHADFSGL